MGLFWELIQQNEINKQGEKTEKIEDRVLNLEKELKETKIILQKTLLALEKHIGKDIDGNGKIGYK